MRKASITGFANNTWKIEDGEFGMLYLPGLNRIKRRDSEVKVLVTIEEIPEEEVTQHGKTKKSKKNKKTMLVK